MEKKRDKAEEAEIFKKLLRKAVEKQRDTKPVFEEREDRGKYYFVNENKTVWIPDL